MGGTGVLLLLLLMMMMPCAAKSFPRTQTRERSIPANPSPERQLSIRAAPPRAVLDPLPPSPALLRAQTLCPWSCSHPLPCRHLITHHTASSRPINSPLGFSHPYYHGYLSRVKLFLLRQQLGPFVWGLADLCEHPELKVGFLSLFWGEVKAQTRELGCPASLLQSRGLRFAVSRCFRPVAPVAS